MTSETKPSSRAGSKTNLNESTMPLLLVEEENRVIHKNPEGSESEKPAKDEKSGSAETFELKEKVSDEDTAALKALNGDTKETGVSGKGKMGGGPKRPTLLDEMTIGLNLLDRDDRNINEPINLAFGDVIAEPDASRGFDDPWRASFAAFTFMKTWVYGILAAIVGVPLAVVWGLVFSLLSFVMIWVVTPLLRVVDVAFSVVRRLVTTIVSTFIEPLFAAIGALLSNIKIRHHTTSGSGAPTTDARGQQTDNIV